MSASHASLFGAVGVCLAERALKRTNERTTSRETNNPDRLHTRPLSPLGRSRSMMPLSLVIGLGPLETGSRRITRAGANGAAAHGWQIVGLRIPMRTREPWVHFSFSPSPIYLYRAMVRAVSPRSVAHMVAQCRLTARGPGRGVWSSVSRVACARDRVVTESRVCQLV